MKWRRASTIALYDASVLIKTRKAHNCHECNKPIPAKSKVLFFQHRLFADSDEELPEGVPAVLHLKGWVCNECESKVKK